VTAYALKHPDGRFLYHLPTPDAFGTPGNRIRVTELTGMYADGQPMEKLHADWWATNHEATRLTATAQPGAKTVGYRLADPTAESVRYPATLTIEEWEERRDDDENLWQFYTNVTEDQPALEHVYEGPVMVLEGREPPGPDEPQWVAQLPHALTERPEYKHLFPGHIAGPGRPHDEDLRGDAAPDFVLLNFQNRPGVYVDLRVPYDEPRTEWRADTSYRTGKRLKSGRTVPVLVSRSLTLPMPTALPPTPTRRPSPCGTSRSRTGPGW
jgi:hypothetical protein